MNAVLILSMMSVGQVRGLEVGSAGLIRAIAREEMRANASAEASGYTPDVIRKQEKAKADAKALEKAAEREKLMAVFADKFEANEAEIATLQVVFAKHDKAQREAAKKSREADKADDLVAMKKYHDISLSEYAKAKPIREKMDSLKKENQKMRAKLEGK